MRVFGVIILCIGLVWMAIGVSNGWSVYLEVVSPMSSEARRHLASAKVTSVLYDGLLYLLPGFGIAALGAFIATRR